MVSFNKNNKRTMKVELENGEILAVLPPTKKLLAQILSLAKASEGSLEENMTEQLYEAAAGILSNNKAGKRFPADSSTVEGLDFDDITGLMQEYLQFTQTIQTDPN